jgi:hypothetical protein
MKGMMVWRLGVLGIDGVAGKGQVLEGKWFVAIRTRCDDEVGGIVILLCTRTTPFTRKWETMHCASLINKERYDRESTSIVDKAVPSEDHTVPV